MIDWSQLGAGAAGAVSAVVAVGGGVWAWWQKNQRTAATTRADVAESDADVAASAASVSAADAQSVIYKQLKDAMASYEKRIVALELGLNSARARAYAAEEKVHVLELYVMALKAALTQAGIPCPAPVVMGG